jgi:hypothetical protein
MIRLTRRITNAADRRTDITVRLNASFESVPRAGDAIDIGVGAPVEVARIIYSVNPGVLLVAELQPAHNSYKASDQQKGFEAVRDKHLAAGWEVVP